MERVEIKPGIYWVGAIDWAVRDFHGYITPKGSTYNNYLLLDDDITLFDAVKADFVDVYIQRIKRLAEFGRIKNIIVNHIEPDHAGGLGHIMRLAPQATLYMTEKGRKGLARYYDVSGWNIKTVKTGDTLCTGKHTLVFLETPMMHWPDSMMTYVREARLLISQDGFGQHLASAQRFDDEFTECSSWAELEDSVWDYYANILMPFGSIIRRKIEEVQGLGLEIDMIAPDHGVIWRKEAGWVLNTYLEMARGKAEERVVIIYDTMWHGTEKMSLAILEGLREEGMDTRVVSLRATPVSVATKEFWRARGTLVGSPTLNNTLLPKVSEFLTNLRGLRPKNRIVGAFGAYGWAGGAIKEILETSKKMGLQTVEPGMGVNYKASAEDRKNCYEFGRDFARKVRQYHKQF